MRTDGRHDEAIGRFSQFCEHASKPVTNSNHKNCYGLSAPLQWRQGTKYKERRSPHNALSQCFVEGGDESVSVELRFLRCQVSACRTKKDWMNVECWWTEMTAENRSALKETCPGSNLTTRNPARMYLWLTQGLRSEKPAYNFWRYNTTAASMCIRRSIFFVSYLILSLETSINVWLRINLFLDKIVLNFAHGNLSCRKYISFKFSHTILLGQKCFMQLTFPCMRDIKA